MEGKIIKIMVNFNGVFCKNAGEFSRGGFDMYKFDIFMKFKKAVSFNILYVKAASFRIGLH